MALVARSNYSLHRRRQEKFEKEEEEESSQTMCSVTH